MGSIQTIVGYGHNTALIAVERVVVAETGVNSDV